MSPVKNQGLYDASLFIAAVSVMEADMRIMNISIPSLSAQQILDCYGHPWNIRRSLEVFSYIKNYGLMSENDYPYIGEK